MEVFECWGDAHLKRGTPEPPMRPMQVYFMWPHGPVESPGDRDSERERERERERDGGEREHSLQ